MKDINLYENIPAGEFPVVVNCNKFYDYKFRLHWHEHVEIHCVLDGKVRLRCGDETLTLSAGDCAVVNGNVLHQGLSGECRYVCVIIPPNFFGKSHVLFDSTFCDGEIYKIMNSIYDEQPDTLKASSMAITGYVYLLCDLLVKRYSRENMSDASYRRHSDKLGKVNKAIKYIEENFAEEVATSSLAEMVHLSEGHFCHLFKDVTGRSAKEYLLSLRIKKAEELLMSSDMNVTDVCYTCGFSDPNYFARVFKKKAGMSPSAYKESAGR